MNMTYLTELAQKEEDYRRFLARVGNSTLSPTGRMVVKTDWKRVERAIELVRENGYESLGEFYIKQRQMVEKEGN